MAFQIIRNDITRVRADAIVDPTDHRYSGSGGTDLAIHTAAGPELRKACDALPACGIGEVQITQGYALPAKYVIHTVGPIWKGGKNGERELLRACYRNALELAAEKGLDSIAFPLIASGTFGYPKAEAIDAAMSEIGRFLKDSDLTVYLVVFDKEALRVSSELYGEVQSYIDSALLEEQISVQMCSAYREDLPFPRSADRSAPISEHRGSFEAEEETDAAYGALPFEDDLQVLEERLKQKDETFLQALLRKIDERGMTDAQCYRKANVEKQNFNKIKNKPNYHPTKTTVIALIFALEPTRAEFDDLLRKAGYSMSRNNAFDIIIEYCLERGNTDVISVNNLLYQWDQPTLGTRYVD